MKHIGIFLLAFGICSSASGAIQMSGVQNASQVHQTGEGFSIYGGTAGSVNQGQCNSKGNTLCNSCTSNLKACNTRRIFPGLALNIEFQYDATTGGTPSLVDTEKNVRLTTIAADTFADGGVANLAILWSSICEQATGDNNCNTGFSKTFKIGLEGSDGNFNEDGSTSLRIVVMGAGGDTVDDCSTTPKNGICQFELYPGDSQVFFSDESLGGLDITGGVEYPNFANQERAIAIRAFVFATEDGSLKGFEGLKDIADLLENFRYHDIPIDDAGNADEIGIPGLVNGDLVFVRLALLDRAGNMSYFTSDQQLSKLGCSASGSGDSNFNGGCKAISSPDAVIGLLSKDYNCFIATAAYGSSLNKQLKIFRAFRSQFLLKTKRGQQLVFWYYKYGSRASVYIQNNRFLKAVTQTLLWPVSLWAQLSLTLNSWFLGLIIALSVFVGSVWSLIFLFNNLRVRRSLL